MILYFKLASELISSNVYPYDPKKEFAPKFFMGLWSKSKSKYHSINIVKQKIIFTPR